MRERVIETTQITKTYGKVLALDHVDICVKRGDIYGLIGDNGAGKSTLLKLLAGHSAASTGEIRLFGEQGEKELQRARRSSGVMIEQPGFFGNLTVENNMKQHRQYCHNSCHHISRAAVHHSVAFTFYII